MFKYHPNPVYCTHRGEHYVPHQLSPSGPLLCVPANKVGTLTFAPSLANLTIKMKRKVGLDLCNI